MNKTNSTAVTNYPDTATGALATAEPVPAKLLELQGANATVEGPMSPRARTNLRSKGAGELTIRRSDPTPLYQQIVDQLKARIAASEFAPSGKLPSSRDLAEFYEVNHLTVRQALKNLQQEKFIEIAHGRGAFVTQPASAALRTALVLPSLGHEQSGILSHAVRSELGSLAILHVMDYHNRLDEEALCLERITRDGYNSAIIYASMRGEAVRTLLRMLVEGFPLVLVDRSFSNVPACYVLSDNRNGGYLATSHLLARGCRRIACFTSNLPSVSERFSGYRDALNEQGVRFDKDLVVELSPDGDQEESATAAFLAARAEAKLPLPDAVFYYNDFEAFKGMKQIKEAGLRIPEDIRVVGFDDHTLGRYSEPSLTSVRQDHEQVGRMAAVALKESMALPIAERFSMRRRVVPVELVVRDSA